MYGVTPKIFMTLILNLPPELEQYLAQEAKQQGVSVETYTLQILQEYIMPKEKQSKLIDVLQSWINEGDVDEQQETGEFLIHALSRWAKKITTM
jgi:predicted trehalose synthase